ncbi:MAG TPA: DUF6390 family protein [Acidimicrobiales bacterium]|nr:DUF6390 family protein [Acidimicrobiales bacterium]
MAEAGGDRVNAPTTPAPPVGVSGDGAPAAGGAVLFARYAFAPNALGYCGPGDPELLFGLAADGRDGNGLRTLSARFDGAWPYLQLIAGCNGLADPLDPRVVEAYWVGNALLDAVPASMVLASLSERFERRAGDDFAQVRSLVAQGVGPHHSLHVFGVYPWIGLLRSGMEGPPLVVLDRCRIRWGTVTEVAGDVVTVRSRRLGWVGSRLVLGDEEEEQARRSIDGTSLTSDLAPGDVVSLHWDWVCDRLSNDAARRLVAYSAHSLQAVNALSRPGPAVAADAHGD